MGSEITRYRIKKIIRTVWIFGLACLLEFVTKARQKAIREGWCDFLGQNGAHGRKADIQFSPGVTRGPPDRMGRDFRLKNGWDRLSLVTKSRFDPGKLRGIECGHVDNRDVDIASIVYQLCS